MRMLKLFSIFLLFFCVSVGSFSFAMKRIRSGEHRPRKRRKVDHSKPFLGLRESVRKILETLYLHFLTLSDAKKFAWEGMMRRRGYSDYMLRLRRFRNAHWEFCCFSKTTLPYKLKRNDKTVLGIIDSICEESNKEDITKRLRESKIKNCLENVLQGFCYNAFWSRSEKEIEKALFLLNQFPKIRLNSPTWALSDTPFGAFIQILRGYDFPCRLRQEFDGGLQS